MFYNSVQVLPHQGPQESAVFTPLAESTHQYLETTSSFLEGFLSLTWMYWPHVYNRLKTLQRLPARQVFQRHVPDLRTETKDPTCPMETTTCKTLLLKWSQSSGPLVLILASQKLQLHMFQAQKLGAASTVRCDVVLWTHILKGQTLSRPGWQFCLLQWFSMGWF